MGFLPDNRVKFPRSYAYCAAICDIFLQIATPIRHFLQTERRTKLLTRLAFIRWQATALAPANQLRLLPFRGEERRLEQRNPVAVQHLV